MRFTDILTLSGQPRGTLHRQLGHLVEEGLLKLGADLCYEPGLRLLKFAHRSWSRNDLRQIAQPYLRRLHEETGETVHLGVLSDLHVVYLDKIESRQTVRMGSMIGRASPLYCTGLGKAMLSVLPDDRREAMLSGLVLQAFTPATHRSLDSLRQDLNDARSRGYAFDLEEHEAQIQCVAAPVHDPACNLIAGVSVTGPAYRVTLERLQFWADSVTAFARAMSDEVACRLDPRQ